MLIACQQIKPWYHVIIIDTHMTSERAAMVSPTNKAWMYFRFSVSCLSFSLAGSSLAFKGNRRKKTETKMAVFRNSPKQYLTRSPLSSTMYIRRQYSWSVYLLPPRNCASLWDPYNVRYSKEKINVLADWICQTVRIVRFKLFYVNEIHILEITYSQPYMKTCTGNL